MKKKELTDKEKLDILVAKVMAVLCDMVQQRVPDDGCFQKTFVTFTYPGTQYQGLLWVEKNVAGAKGNCRLIAGMREADSDKVVQHYMAKGTKEEMMQWLRTEDNGEQLRGSYAQLKNAVDQFD